METLKVLFKKAYDLGANKLFFAEYSMSPKGQNDTPHLLAALTQQLVEAHINDSVNNIRCVISIDEAKAAAESSGWVIKYEEEIETPDLDDGIWEVSTVVNSEVYLNEVFKIPIYL